MKRRQFITTLAFATSMPLLSGCINGMDAAVNKDLSKKDIKIKESSLYKNDGEAGVKGEVENTTRWEVGFVKLNVEFLNSKGDKIAGKEVATTEISPHSTQEFDISIENGKDGINIDHINDYKLSFELPTGT